MKSVTCRLLLGLWLVMMAPLGTASQRADSVPDAKIAQAFDQYERVRAALSADSLAGVREGATALAPLAKEIGGANAGTAATKLASATRIKDARARFGDVSDALVETFLAAGIPGVHGFTCAMVKKPWAQRGEKTQNPYYGKSMPTCGVPLKATAAK